MSLRFAEYDLFRRGTNQEDLRRARIDLVIRIAVGGPCAWKKEGSEKLDATLNNAAGTSFGKTGTRLSRTTERDANRVGNGRQVEGDKLILFKPPALRQSRSIRDGTIRGTSIQSCGHLIDDI